MEASLQSLSLVPYNGRMPLVRSVFVLTILLSSLIHLSCSSSTKDSNATNAGANSSNTSNTGPKDNVEEFADLVRLPFTPEEVAWKEAAGGKGVTAVVRFSPENAAKMAAEVAKNGQPSIETLTVETWYPAELIAQSEMTGESTVKGQSYPADPFLNPPYSKGKITRVENTDYFIIQISS